MSLVNIDLAAVTVFLLVLARTTAWAVTAPLLSMPGVPQIARLGFAVALSVFLTPLMMHGTHPPTGIGDFVLLVAAQVAIGLALGFLSNLPLVAVQLAGSLGDFFSGFSFGSLIDPVSGAASAAFARLTTMTFITVLFATDAYQTIVRGLTRSFLALPVTSLPHVSSNGAVVVVEAVGQALVAALQIGAPLLGVLFLTDVAVAITARFVPQANAMAISLPAKGLVALACAGMMLATLPGQLDGLIGGSITLPGAVLR